MVKGRDALAYVLYKMGCLHPFVASRVLALAELRLMEERGERLTELDYVRGPGVFYIEGVKEMLGDDPCFNKREGDPSKKKRSCLEYRCGLPELPGEARRLLDEAIERAGSVDEMTLNDMVMKHPLYEKLTRPMK